MYTLLRRELALVAVLAGCAVVLYFATRELAQGNRRTEIRVASYWYAQGNELLGRKDWPAAVQAFRKAARNDRENRIYTRALARSLEAAGRNDEAQALLLQVRGASPEDPGINLELAQIAEKKHNLEQAVWYYHNALYGIWSGDDIDHQRRQVRRQLIDYLIEQKAPDQALSEILALAAHLPDTEAAHLELGTLFLKVGDPARALGSFRWVLRSVPHDYAALTGAGAAAFHLALYRQARQYLGSSKHLDPEQTRMLKLAGMVVRMDPLAGHLSMVQRNRIARSDLKLATAGLRACFPQDAAQREATADELDRELGAELSNFSPARLREDQSLVYEALALIDRTEELIRNSCPNLTDSDMALRLVSQDRRGADQ